MHLLQHLLTYLLTYCNVCLVIDVSSYRGGLLRNRRVIVIVACTVGYIVRVLVLGCVGRGRAVNWVGAVERQTGNVTPRSMSCWQGCADCGCFKFR